MKHQKIGYARVSTEDQNLDLQKDALKKAGCAEIYEEKISGTKKERPALEYCIKALRRGDVLVVWRLDRLGRSMSELIHLINSFKERGVLFESLTEKIDTTNAAGELIFHIFASMAEFERNLNKERSHAGLTAARARGKHLGRAQKLDRKQIVEIHALLRDPNVQVKSVAKLYKVSRSTIYRRVGAVTPSRSNNI